MTICGVPDSQQEEPPSDLEQLTPGQADMGTSEGFSAVIEHLLRERLAETPEQVSHARRLVEQRRRVYFCHGHDVALCLECWETYIPSQQCRATCIANGIPLGCVPCHICRASLSKYEPAFERRSDDAAVIAAAYAVAVARGAEEGEGSGDDAEDGIDDEEEGSQLSGSGSEDEYGGDGNSTSDGGDDGCFDNLWAGGDSGDGSGSDDDDGSGDMDVDE